MLPKHTPCWSQRGRAKELPELEVQTTEMGCRKMGCIVPPAQARLWAMSTEIGRLVCRPRSSVCTRKVLAALQRLEQGDLLSSRATGAQRNSLLQVGIRAVHHTPASPSLHPWLGVCMRVNCAQTAQRGPHMAGGAY